MGDLQAGDVPVAGGEPDGAGDVPIPGLGAHRRAPDALGVSRTWYARTSLALVHTSSIYYRVYRNLPRQRQTLLSASTVHIPCFGPCQSTPSKAIASPSYHQRHCRRFVLLLPPRVRFHCYHSPPRLAIQIIRRHSHRQRPPSGVGFISESTEIVEGDDPSLLISISPRHVTEFAILKQLVLAFTHTHISQPITSHRLPGKHIRPPRNSLR